MKTYTVTYNNMNDHRSVVSNVDWKTAIKTYSKTKKHQMFFQDDHTKDEKNTGIVTLIDQYGDEIYVGSCRRVRK